MNCDIKARDVSNELQMYNVKRYICRSLCSTWSHLIIVHRVEVNEKSLQSVQRNVWYPEYFPSIVSQLPLTGCASLAYVIRSFAFRHPCRPYLRPWVAPYFKCHISRDHASSASKMSMPPAGFATTTSHDSSPSWRRGIVSPSRLATNYTLMRRRVIRRRCTKWKR